MSSILILFLIIILIAAVITFGTIRRNKPKSNRYVRTKKKLHREPHIGKMNSIKPRDNFDNWEQTAPISAIEIEVDVNMDADAILGLKKSDAEQKEVIKQTKQKEQKQPEPEQGKESSLNQSSVIVYHVMAEPEHPYTGYELLQALLSSGLRYGAMNIFHRHEHKTGRGAVIFSVAAVNKPGTFDLQKMGGFSCPGLTLFLVLNKVKDPLKAYDLMLETAGQLVEDLGGEVLDHLRSLLTRDNVIEQRKKIRNYEENQRTVDLFADEYARVD